MAVVQRGLAGGTACQPISTRDFVQNVETPDAGETACATFALEQLADPGGQAFSLPDFYHGLSGMTGHQPGAGGRGGASGRAEFLGRKHRLARFRLLQLETVQIVTVPI